MTTPARDLIDVVLGDRRDLTLPSLTREELVAIGDEPMLAEAEDELWWQAQGDEVREALVAASHRGLVARELLEPDMQTGGLIATDAVRIVLETRKHPSWLCIVREPVAQDETRILIQGIERDDAPAAAMITARVEGIYLSRLTSADTALDEAVRWLLDPEFHTDTPEGMDPAGRPLLRAVEILLPQRPGVRDEMSDQRALLAVVDGTWRLAEVDAQGKEFGERVAEEVELRSWLRRAVLHADADADAVSAGSDRTA